MVQPEEGPSHRVGRYVSQNSSISFVQREVETQSSSSPRATRRNVGGEGGGRWYPSSEVSAKRLRSYAFDEEETLRMPVPSTAELMLTRSFCGVRCGYGVTPSFTSCRRASACQSPSSPANVEYMSERDQRVPICSDEYGGVNCARNRQRLMASLG